MRKFAVGAALLALIAGGVGYVLRYQYFERAVEADTGLPVFSSPSLLTMVYYTAFIIVLAFVLAYIARRSFDVHENYREVIAPINLFYLCCMAAVFVLLLASGAISIVQAVSADTIDYIVLIRAVFIVMTGISLFGMTYEASNKKDSRGSLVFSIIPEIAITFWLLIYYRSNQINPIILSYVYYALALAASAFGFYFTAGYVYGRCAPLRLIFSYSTAVYFLIMSLADDIPLTDKLCFIGLALFFTVNLSRFVGNLLPKKKAPHGTANIEGQNTAVTEQ